jgi:hypothetical protein
MLTGVFGTMARAFGWIWALSIRAKRDTTAASLRAELVRSAVARYATHRRPGCDEGVNDLPAESADPQVMTLTAHSRA